MSATQNSLQRKELQTSDHENVKRYVDKLSTSSSHHGFGVEDSPEPTINTSKIVNLRCSNSAENGELHAGDSFGKREKLLNCDPMSQSERKKLIGEERNKEVLDPLMMESTSNSSSAWTSSIKGIGTSEQPCSSSSRSCLAQGEHTVFQRYDEEMMLFHRLAASKLSEIDTLKSVERDTRPVSHIIKKLARTDHCKNNSTSLNGPYNVLEAAYVAQICLTWEALSWNYRVFQELGVSKGDRHTCPAYTAQQMQQFQVLLQRYLENESYEPGRRAEIYTRMRSSSPNLFLVAEYRDFNIVGPRISSSTFLKIMKDAFQAFMNFLRVENESCCLMIKRIMFLKSKHPFSVDQNFIRVLKKVNNQKRSSIKELYHTGCCNKRCLNEEEEMEFFMALIDLKVVSRVLRMVLLTEEQLLWCEKKMSKVRVSKDNVQRDSSPLIFPTHEVLN